MSENVIFAPYEDVLYNWASIRGYAIRERRFHSEQQVVKDARIMSHEQNLQEILNDSSGKRHDAEYRETKLEILSGCVNSKDIEREIIYPFGFVKYELGRDNQKHLPINSDEELDNFIKTGLPYTVSIIWSMGKKINDFRNPRLRIGTLEDSSAAMGYLHMENLPNSPMFEASINFLKGNFEKNRKRSTINRMLLAASSWSDDFPMYNIELKPSNSAIKNVEKVVRLIDTYVACPTWD